MPTLLKLDNFLQLATGLQLFPPVKGGEILVRYLVACWWVLHNMSTNVIMPQMGESVAEGTILKWLVQEGEKVSRDQSLVEISTDKIDTEIPSPVTGILKKILDAVDETVPVGSVIAEIS